MGYRRGHLFYLYLQVFLKDKYFLNVFFTTNRETSMRMMLRKVEWNFQNTR